MAEYQTVSAALAAVGVAIEDTIKDQPNLAEYEDDVYHDMVQAIMFDCDPEVIRELSRVTGVAIPSYFNM